MLGQKPQEAENYLPIGWVEFVPRLGETQPTTFSERVLKGRYGDQPGSVLFIFS